MKSSTSASTLHAAVTQLYETHFEALMLLFPSPARPQLGAQLWRSTCSPPKPVWASCNTSMTLTGINFQQAGTLAYSSDLKHNLTLLEADEDLLQELCAHG